MLSLALVFAASVAEQMAPAKQGMLQCQSPISSMKTCDSLSKVSQVGPDRYRFESEIMLDADGPVLATERNTTTVHGTKVCEPVRLAEINNWTFKVAGAPAGPAQVARFRAVLKQRLAPLSGQTLCTAIVPDEEGMYTVQAFMGGRRVEALDYSMKWVSPNDGWKVAP